MAQHPEGGYIAQTISSHSLFALEAPGFLGMFGRFAVIGDRLSPFVSCACMIMALLGE